MEANYRACAWINLRPFYRPPMAIAIVLIILSAVFSPAAMADNWTGAGQAPANQTRDWNQPSNWANGINIPPANDQNTLTPIGEGKIELNGRQSAGAMIFNNFTYTAIVPGELPADLTMVNPLQGGSRITMGEGVRDTYGVDYFTAGPQFTADVILGAPLAVNLGTNAANRLNSAMMFSGQIGNPLTNPLTYTGAGGGTSLWISSYNEFNGSPLNPVTITSGGGGNGGYILHLVDAGRLDGTLLNPTPIVLQSVNSFLGLQDNTGGGVPPVANQYFNWVKSSSGNVFADRSYQLNDSDATVNVLQKLMGGVTVYGGTARFGAGGSSDFGQTNNGYGIRLASLNWDTVPGSLMINVNNGNLTAGRGGSRYVSGANRLQEPHNYTYVDNASENAGNLVQLTKAGNGVLAIEQVNGGGQWKKAPRINQGVLRLGTPTQSHTILVNESITLQSSNTALGLGWDAFIDLNNSWAGGIKPFGVTPGGNVSGQSGAVNIDLWGHGILGNTVDPNVLKNQTLTYLRVGSSMGGDASFDPRPNSLKHASTSATIVPARAPQSQRYYLGGGGGTLQINSLLVDHFPNTSSITSLEMGTTGNLLPGRVALNPGGEQNGNNTYTSTTDIWAGTLQLMKQGSLRGTSGISLTTDCLNITNGLYDNPNRFNNTSWKGPGQLLLDPVTDPESPNFMDWNLSWYKANGGGPLINALNLDGGVIGWTDDVILTGVPGNNYGTPITSNLGNVQWSVNVLGLGGEYSSGTMTTSQFVITDSQHPVLLYKAGINSKLDLRQTPGGVNTYTGGTIIAGGEIIINNPNQICAGPFGGMYGKPIVILNGGKLHITEGFSGLLDKSIMINTDGTPNLQKNCGSVLEIDEGVIVETWALFDFSWAPAQYLEKTGLGTFLYNAQGPWTPTPGPANAWGLKLTDGLVIVDQLPVNPGNDTGPVIFNGGNLEVIPLPFPDYNEDLPYDPAYGFRNIVSFQGTGALPNQNTVTVNDNAMFRTHGSVPNEILGTVHFIANDNDSNPSNNVVHLSRNMSPAGDGSPGYNSRGNGTLTFEGVTVYMSGGGAGNSLSVLPQEAGFTLKLRNGAVFYASQQNTVNGNVYFENTNSSPVQIDGEEASPPTPASLYTFTLVPQTWVIAGTGLTSWLGTTEKIGAGTVAIKRSQGAPVEVNPDALLKISDGTFEAGGTADPFTDNTLNPGLSMDIVNNSAAPGLLISQGVKNVDTITGTGNTTVSGPAGTELIVTSIAQNTVTLGAGCTLTIRPLPGGPIAAGGITPVPEPATWIMLVLAAVGLSIWPARNRFFKSGV